MKARSKAHTITYIVKNGWHFDFKDYIFETKDPEKIKVLETKGVPWTIVKEDLTDTRHRRELYKVAKDKGWTKSWNISKRDDLIKFLEEMVIQTHMKSDKN